MGGLVITQTAEYCPEKIQLLFYVCAFLPTNEQNLLQILENDKKDIPPAVVISEDKTLLKLEKHLIKDTFYGECSENDSLEAEEKLCLQPLSPFITPARVTEHNFGSVPRVYIETLKDNAISTKCQREMHTKTPCRQVLTMDTDHSPFFSQPEVLFSHLKNLGS
ncbi:hypothetical protein PP175_04075 [Aneurinibacillus sp. Ricciae_BoGa-3]|uniref:hypothetical protein n=1 Tax=Aneurinibacillus sp. Ricciae_BoGa-3 TaxID=3022697 RepID=UPI0023427908|nr:hypothetical protein [Aneurinibacillus sp. Ricciae_BoGa-3]WCK55173.1 hypothetical protein PP175_04075 [Aneurinibacillus sp. Ricciae_BoGa-3]